MNNQRPLVTREFYHVFNRGIEQKNIFRETKDYERFLKVVNYYQFQHVKNIPFSSLERYSKEQNAHYQKLIELICDCQMPNHFHCLIQQTSNGGIAKFISQIQNSYTRYFNIKYKRIGPLFQGIFKAVRIETEEQLIHLSRYIHLNPYVAGLVNNPEDYRWSSYRNYLTNRIKKENPILAHFGNPQNYRKFVNDYADYARNLAKIKDLTDNNPV